MDFSPGRVAKLLAQDSLPDPENSGLKVITTPTMINAGRCFLRDFESTLPYCESSKDEIKNRVLMDDEWILQFEVRFLLCVSNRVMAYRPLLVGGGFVWLGGLHRFPQHFTHRKHLQSFKLMIKTFFISSHPL